MRRRLVLQALRPNAWRMPIRLDRFRTLTLSVFSPMSARLVARMRTARIAPRSAAVTTPRLSAVTAHARPQAQEERQPWQSGFRHNVQVGIVCVQLTQGGGVLGVGFPIGS